MPGIGNPKRRIARVRLLQWLTAAAVAIAVPAGFVAAVDPFGFFGTNTVGYYYSSEREFKPNLVRAAPYDALALGDSRVAYTDTSLIGLPYRFLNGGIGGGTLWDAVTVLRASRLGDLKLVVIGLTYGSFARPGSCEEKRSPERSPVAAFLDRLLEPIFEPIRFSASWLQLWYAVDALRAKAKGEPPYYRPDGTRVSTDKDLSDATLPGKTERYWSLIRHDAEVIAAVTPTQPGLVVDETCLRLLAGMVDLARQHGFRLVLVFMPLNRDFLDAGLAAWLASDYSRRSIVRVREVAPYVVNLFDSRFSDSANFWLHDPNHFRPHVGARMIEEAIRTATPPS
jgi:hypothetical protein